MQENSWDRLVARRRASIRSDFRAEALSRLRTRVR